MSPTLCGRDGGGARSATLGATMRQDPAWAVQAAPWTGEERFSSGEDLPSPEAPSGSSGLDTHKQELRANGICLLVVRMTHGEQN
jgi:hypothetical protein